MLGIQGFKFAVKDSVETWFKPLSGGDWAVCFLNRTKETVEVNFNWGATRVYDNLAKRDLNAGETEYSLFNIWTKVVEGTTKKNH